MTGFAALRVGAALNVNRLNVPECEGYMLVCLPTRAGSMWRDRHCDVADTATGDDNTGP